jgi:hypothetical protein
VVQLSLPSRVRAVAKALSVRVLPQVHEVETNTQKACQKVRLEAPAGDGDLQKGKGRTLLELSFCIMFKNTVAKGACDVMQPALLVAVGLGRCLRQPHFSILSNEYRSFTWFAS